jgi:hypothetical protein
MVTVNFTVRHRPVRIGFLVRPGDFADLQSAAALCCVLWGGVYNPVIPVAAAMDATADDLLREFQVDLLFPVGQSAEISKFVARYPWLRSPRVSGNDILVADWRTKRNTVAYLDVLNAIDKYWEQEFKHAAVGSDSACRLVTWDENDTLRHLFAIGFGAYDGALNLKDDFRDAFLKELRASEVHIPDGSDIPADLVRKTTPMRLTGADLRVDGRFRTWTGGLYFGNAADVADLTAFWNIRASGGAVEFVCLKSAPRMGAFAKAHLAHLDSLPQRHPNIEDHIAFFFRNDQDAVLAELKTMPIKKRPLLYPLQRPSANLGSASPAFDLDSALGLVDRDAGGDYSVTLTLPEKEFLGGVRMPRQQLMASIEPHGDFGYPGYTLEPPFRIALTEFYSRKIHIDPWSVRTEPDGIGLFISTYDKTAHLRPMKHAAVVEALFGEAKMSLQASVGGRLADRLLEALGGYEATRVFKIRGVRNLIAQFDSQTPIGRGEATNAIWNGGQFKDHERLYIEARDAPTLTAATTFDFLLKHGFYRAGLEFKCDNCGLLNWLSLRQVDDRWICEYCGHSGITSLHIRDRGDWKFRKSGLLARDNNQEGAIPVLLSLLTLGRVFDERLLRLTSFNVLTGVPPCEIDFTALYHHRGEISCGIGEAKAAGGEIDGNDVKNLKAVADALKKADIAPYLVFSKTADAFLPREIALFHTARDEGYGVVLLTNAEMEPYHPYYESADKDKLPSPYGHSFDEMVANTAFRYFR